MRKPAVNASTRGEAMPKASMANKTGSAKPSMFVEPRVTRQTSQAATRPAAEATIRLPLATCSRVWQCGHSRPSENAITSVAGTVLPQCGQIRVATLHLTKSKQR